MRAHVSDFCFIAMLLYFAQTSAVLLKVEAFDGGSPPLSSTVDVTIHITQTINAYPQWSEDYAATPFHVSENAPRDEVVARLRAVSSQPHSPYVNYAIQVPLRHCRRRTGGRARVTRSNRGWGNCF